MFRPITRPIAVVVLAAALVTCRDATGPDADARAIQVNSPPERAVLVGDTFRLQAVVWDAHGDALAGARVVFRSDAPEVATVDSTGVVTAGSAGTANIGAWSGGVGTAVHVTVAWGGLGWFRLETAPDSVIHASRWSALPVYVHFAASNGVDQASVCGRVPLSFRSDSSIAYVEYAPLPGDPCTLRIVARGAGSTRLTVTGPGLDVSPARIEVTDDRYWVGLERLGAAPFSGAVAGTRVAYRLTVLDENGRRAAGVELRFEGTDGQVLESRAVTDTAGTATVHWQVPAWGSTATLRAAVADGSHAQASIGLKPSRTCVGVFERLEGLHAGDTVFTGTTVRYRLTVRDDTGQPVWGLRVWFVAWEGVVTPTPVSTDSDGTATTNWTFPTIRVWAPTTVRLFALGESNWVIAQQSGLLRNRYRWVMEREDGGSFAEPLLVGSTIKVRLRALDDATGLPVPGVKAEVGPSWRWSIFSPSEVVTDSSGTARVTWTLPTSLPWPDQPPTMGLSGSWPDGLMFSATVYQEVKADRPARIVPSGFFCNYLTGGYNPGWNCGYMPGENFNPNFPSGPSYPFVVGDTVNSFSQGMAADVGAMLVDQYHNFTEPTAPITITADQENSIRQAPDNPFCFSCGPWGEAATVVVGRYAGLAPGFSSQWITISSPGVPSRRFLVRRLR